MPQPGFSDVPHRVASVTVAGPRPRCWPSDLASPPRPAPRGATRPAILEAPPAPCCPSVCSLPGAGTGDFSRAQNSRPASRPPPTAVAMTSWLSRQYSAESSVPSTKPCYSESKYQRRFGPSQIQRLLMKQIRVVGGLGPGRSHLSRNLCPGPASSNWHLGVFIFFTA